MGFSFLVFLITARQIVSCLLFRKLIHSILIGNDQQIFHGKQNLTVCFIQSAKRQKLFWISAAAPLTSVILSTIIVFAVKPTTRQIPIVSTCYYHPTSLKYSILPSKNLLKYGSMCWNFEKFCRLVTCPRA